MAKRRDTKAGLALEIIIMIRIRDSNYFGIYYR